MANDSGLKASVEGWIVRYIEDNGLTVPVTLIVLVCILFYVLGLVSLWVWKRASLITDCDKSLSEAIKNSIENAKSVNDASDGYVDATDTLNLGLRQLLDAIRSGDASRMVDAREELCRAFGTDYFRCLRNLLVLREASRNKQHNRAAVKGEAIRALKTALKFLQTVNGTELLNRIGNPSPFMLDPTTLTPLREYIRRFNPIWAIPTRLKYRSLNRRLVAYEKD
ncbi:MAG: hypothetical protein AB7T27_10130 [Kiritimatiellia bacterium]